jgi:hypothetical protein
MFFHNLLLVSIRLKLSVDSKQKQVAKNMLKNRLAVDNSG